MKENVDFWQNHCVSLQQVCNSSAADQAGLIVTTTSHVVQAAENQMV
jgi:hypothetical protein